ncbi:4025_t:CDS:1, partial [Ambispora gerdemannii]
MKFASILALFLISFVVIAQAFPVRYAERASALLPGFLVSYSDEYEKLVNDLKQTNKMLDAKITSFNQEVLKYGSDLPKSVFKWSARYRKLVDASEVTVAKLEEKVVLLRERAIS